MKDLDTKNKCKMCGVCCKLFYINLNETEYKSGEFKTILNSFEKIEDFTFAEENGLIFLAKKENGECIYLEKNLCSIHSRRPTVCRGFFCNSKEKKYEKMRAIILKEKHR